MPGPSLQSQSGIETISVKDRPSGGTPGVSHPDRIAYLLLFTASLALYVSTTGFNFVVDDKLLLARNPYVLSLHYLKDIFTSDFWGFLGARGETGYYRPLIMLTLLLERLVFGLRPAWYHLVNVVLNAGVSLLVYRLARIMWPKSKGALWAGLLFAVLPVHVEAVAPVSGISDLQCALFMLLSAAIYMRPLDGQGRLPRRSAWLAAAVFLLAAFSKEIALALPLLLIFYEHFLRPGEPRTWWMRIERYVPMLLATLLYLAARFAALGRFSKPYGGTHLGFKPTVLYALSLLGAYASKLVWPQHLTAYLRYRPPESAFDLPVMLGGGFTLLAFFVFFRYWRRERSISFAILWFFLILGPAINVRWLGLSPYGEHYLYLPSAAFCWLAGEGLGKLQASESEKSHKARLFAGALSIVLLGLLSMRTLRRLPDWKNNLTLALATLRETPDAGPYHVYVGNAYREAGQRGLARQEYVAAIALDPSVIEAYLNLAGILAEDGSVGGSRFILRRAAELDPSFPEIFYTWGVIELGQGNKPLARALFERAVALNPNYCDALNNLGVMSLEEGDLEAAQKFLARSIAADPFSESPHSNLGSVLSRKGDLRGAEAEFRRAIQIAPSDGLTYMLLASLYEQQGKTSAALDTYHEALRVQPESATAEFRLGVLMLKLGRVPEAIEALERAEKIQPNSPLVHTELGAAYQSSGRVADARRELKMALQLKPDNEVAKSMLRKLE
jgi:Flp pilus assembly protein TadD